MVVYLVVPAALTSRARTECIARNSAGGFAINSFDAAFVNRLYCATTPGSRDGSVRRLAKLSTSFGTIAMASGPAVDKALEIAETDAAGVTSEESSA